MDNAAPEKSLFTFHVAQAVKETSQLFKDTGGQGNTAEGTEKRAAAVYLLNDLPALPIGVAPGAVLHHQRQPLGYVLGVLDRQGYRWVLSSWPSCRCRVARLPRFGGGAAQVKEDKRGPY